MEIFRHIDDQGLKSGPSVVTMGNFDGLHIGHQALVRNAVVDGARLGLPSVVLTFEPHPLKILAPERAPQLILSHKDKMQVLQSCGVDAVVIQNFDDRFARMEAGDFVEEVLIKRLKIRKIWVGSDLRFGRARQGSVPDLARFGEQRGFEVGIVDPILVGGVRVSSSCIRQLVLAGRVDEVQPLLGRFHFVSGKVIAGNRRGRALGFPTANIACRTELIPSNGIYATLTEVGGKRHLSASSVGTNPTFGEGPRTVESFIFDFDHDIYGAAVKLFFVRRLRDELKFASVDQLIAQMQGDVARARAAFAELGLGVAPA